MTLSRYLKPIVESHAEPEASNIVIDIIGLQDVVSEVENTSETICAAVDDTQTLERQISNAENSLIDGGLNATAATALSIASEAFAKKMKLQVGVETFSLEAFSSGGDKLRVSKVAIESVKELAKKAWERIKKWYEQVKEFIKQAIGKIFNTWDSIKSRAEKLRKDIIESKKSATESSKVYYHKSIPGKIDIKLFLESGTDNIAQLQIIIKELKDQIKAIERANNPEDVKQAVRTAKKNIVARSVTKNTVTVGDVEQAVMTTDQGDGKVVMINVAGDNANISVNYANQNNEPTDPEPEEPPSFTPEDSLVACEMLIKMAEKNKNMSEDTRSFNSDMDKLMTKVISNYENGPYSAPESKKAITDLVSNTSKIATTAQALLVKRAVRALNWLEASFKRSKNNPN